MSVGVGDVVVVVGVGDVVVGVGVGDVVVGVGVGDDVVVWVGDVVTGWVVVPVCADDALDVGVGCLVAVADADALVGVPVTEEICAAGDWAGVVGGCPRELRANAAPAPPSTSTPMIAASTSVRRRRRPGPSVPDGGSVSMIGGEPPSGVPSAGVDQSSVGWYGGEVAEPATDVCVIARPGTGTVGAGGAMGGGGGGAGGGADNAVGMGATAGADAAATMPVSDSGSQFPTG